MGKAYKIQSKQQEELIEALASYENLVIRPGNPPILFELMGHIGLSRTHREDRLLIESQGVHQLLSIQWSEIRLAYLNENERSFFLSNGEQSMLEIQNTSGKLQKLRQHIGLLQPLPKPPPEDIQLKIQNGWYLGPVRPEDLHAYILHLNDRQIYQYTMNIPYPYEKKDATQWIASLDLCQSRMGQACNLAIRNQAGQLCGSIGLNIDQPGKHKVIHQAEVGYWLAKPYWGHGIMTAALQAFCHWAFATYRLNRIAAHVFVKNIASERVLQKAGFQLEGHMTNHYFKEGESHDARLYALTRN